MRSWPKVRGHQAVSDSPGPLFATSTMTRVQITRSLARTRDPDLHVEQPDRQQVPPDRSEQLDLAPGHAAAHSDQQHTPPVLQVVAKPFSQTIERL
jgi:hypothetical protein